MVPRPWPTLHRKNQIRMAARESFTRTASSEVIRRAELRQVRPSRGPFPIGTTYVFYYDAASKQPGSNCCPSTLASLTMRWSSGLWSQMSTPSSMPCRLQVAAVF